MEADLSQATDADYLRAMAEEARALADEMTDAESKQSMLEIAAGYELLANGARSGVPTALSSAQQGPMRSE